MSDFTLPVLIAVFYALVLWKTRHYTSDLEKPRHQRRRHARRLAQRPLDLRAEWEKTAQGDE